MNKDFDNINDLIEEVKQDKVAQGANSSMLNRYPVRFVLFDNFSDSKSFVSELIELGVTKMQKIIDWMDKNNPDQMLTYTILQKGLKTILKPTMILIALLFHFLSLPDSMIIIQLKSLTH